MASTSFIHCLIIHLSPSLPRSAFQRFRVLRPRTNRGPDGLVSLGYHWTGFSAVCEFLLTRARALDNRHRAMVILELFSTRRNTRAHRKAGYGSPHLRRARHAGKGFWDLVTVDCRLSVAFNI